MEEGGKTVKNKKCFFCLKNVRGISTFSLSSTCPGEKLRARGIGRLDFSDRKMGIDPRQKKISKVFIDLRERIAVFFLLGGYSYEKYNPEKNRRTRKYKTERETGQ